MGAGSAGRWVVQEHQARGHHYDLRLEIDAVLVSWAVPKGPSTDPRVRRLARRVDDHALDQLLREGAEGPGRGTIVWDRGSYRLLPGRTGAPPDAAGALEDGHLVVELTGAKLQGGYALTRTGGSDWLLVKMRDAWAEVTDVLAAEPQSVLTGMTLAQVIMLGSDRAPPTGEAHSRGPASG